MVGWREKEVKGMIIVKSKRGGDERNARQRHRVHKQCKPILKPTKMRQGDELEEGEKRKEEKMGEKGNGASDEGEFCEGEEGRK